MEVTGKVKVIDPEQQVSASFVKRDIVITTEEQYPQDIQIQFTQDKVDILDAYKPGDEVTVSINLRGRAWVNPQGETKYFNTIQGWRIQKVRNTAPDGQAAPEAGPTQNAGPEATPTQFEEEGDDLLF